MNERSFIIFSMRIRDPRKEAVIRLKAMEMAVKEGFDGLSMQKIARAAKVSPGTLYTYFEDRDDLILQVYLEESEKAFAAMMENFDPGLSFAQGLRVQWFNRARYYMKNPRAMLFLEQFKHTPLHERALALGSSAFRETMQAFVRGAIRRGELVQAPIEVYWSVAFAPLYQLIKFHSQGKSLPGAGKFVLDETLLLQTLELVLKALTPSLRDKETTRPDPAPKDPKRKRAS
jgi:AcrR family transcriptional regulator